MKKSIRFALCAAALLAPPGALVWSADPEPTAPVAHVAVLETGRVLEGDIERVGDQYRLRRTIGETWLPAKQVQCVCATLEEAYLFLRSQTNLHDADERLRLARWCQQHGLRKQALAEVSAALELRPNHAESQRMWQNLQRTETPAAAAKPHEDNEPDAVPPTDFNAEAIGQFVTRVQPLLMNTCANCHATGHGGAFKLVRTYDSALTNRRATQQNLAAVLAQVNRERPQQSVLLARALSPHGDAEVPPLKGRQTPAYHILEDWVQVALLNSATGGSVAVPAVPAPAAPAPTDARVFADVPVQKTPAPVTPPTVPAPSPIAPAASPPAPVTATVPAAAAAPPVAPPASAEPADPFDPVIFNRQMHPEKAPGR